MGSNLNVNNSYLNNHYLNLQCCKTAKSALDLDNLNLTNEFEKKLTNNSKSNFYTKEQSISNKRKLLMKDILELLKLKISYNERKKEIEEYIKKNKSYKTLNLTVASTSLNFSKTSYSITPYGMIDGESSNNKDGIVLFGYEFIDNIEGDSEEENYKKNLSIYDFIFPMEKEYSINLKEFPSFSIYFNPKDENYYIKDFNIGIGALMKIKKHKFENNILINIGANYLVICLEKDNIIIKIFNNSILENKENEKKFEIKKFPINKKSDKIITIGRSKKCDLVIDDMMMSKIQSSIKYNSKENAFYLYDGNFEKESMNGTWIYIVNPILITDNFIFKAEHTLFVVNLIQNK